MYMGILSACTSAYQKRAFDPSGLVTGPLAKQALFVFAKSPPLQHQMSFISTQKDSVKTALYKIYKK